MTVIPRLLTQMFGLLGAVSLGLSCAGMLAAIQVLVHRRRKEIGIRLAVGAARRNIVISYAIRTSVLFLVSAGVGTIPVIIVWIGCVRLFGDISPASMIMAIFAELLALSLIMAIGCVPAWRACDMSISEQLREP